MTPADRDAAVALAQRVVFNAYDCWRPKPTDDDALKLARAALVLRRLAVQQAALEAARRTDQHARRQRVARQARDARGRWVRG